MRPFNLLALLVLGLVSLDSAFGFDAMKPFKHDKIESVKEKTTHLTPAQKIAISHKPMINIEDGCDVYPAVTKDGHPSGGLKPSGSPSGKCSRRGLDSQIYGRNVWLDHHQTKLALMTAFYFPKGAMSTTDSHIARKLAYGRAGVQHFWQHVVQIFDVKPAAKGDKDLTVKLVGYALGWNNKLVVKKDLPALSEMEGSHVKLKVAFADGDIKRGNDYFAHLALTDHEGSLFPYLFYGDLTDAARATLSGDQLGHPKSPLADESFNAIIKSINDTMYRTW